MKTVLTYGTFDLFHLGHLNLLERLAAMGDRLIVGVSTDEFNESKGKNSIFSYHERARIIAALSCVDLVIEENTWSQKVQDIEDYSVNVFGMGADWKGKFPELEGKCELVYLERTPSISTTHLRRSLSSFDDKKIQQIKQSLDSIQDVIKALE